MPLINLKTNLKSLGYGSDRPDGGSSNQPYIVADIPGGESFAQDLIVQARANDTSLPDTADFLLRNGYLAAIKSLQDTERLGKYFIDLKSPSGLLFTVKQELLERQNVDVADGINRIYNPLGTVGQAGVLATGYHLNKQGFNVFREGYYNGGNTGYFNFTNTANRGGEDRLSLLFKSKLTNSIDGFEALAGKNLYGITPFSDTVNLLSYSGGPGSVLGIGKTNIRIQNSTRTTVDIKEDQKFQPSFYSTVLNDPKYLVINNGLRPSINWVYNPRIENPGVSNAAISEFNLEEDQTAFYPNDNVSLILGRNENVSGSNADTTSLNPNIKATKSNTGDPNKEFTVKRPFINWIYNPRIENPGVSNAFISEFDLEENQTSFYPDDSADSLLNRKDLPASSIDSTNNTYLFNYSQSFSQDSKHTNQSTALIGVKDFRKTINENEGEDVLPSTDYSTFNREDKYNASKTTYKGNVNKDGKRVLNPNESISPDQTEIGVTGEDIIDFNFNIINNSGDNKLIDFRAYLESWSDGTEANWAPIKYMGRAENFYKYNGFSRSANVTFLVPTLSRKDLIRNYKLLNSLMWTTAPSYSSGENSTIAGIMRGSITKFTMGDYFRGMPCIIQSVKLSEIEGMGWDINRDENGEILTPDNQYYTGQLPKGIKADVSLIPLHNFVPQYGQAFIGQSDLYV
jgi:hypothetical protein